MKEQEKKRKSPVTSPVRNKETTIAFANITDVSTGLTVTGGRERRSAGGGGDI